MKREEGEKRGKEGSTGEAGDEKTKRLGMWRSAVITPDGRESKRDKESEIEKKKEKEKGGWGQRRG